MGERPVKKTSKKYERRRTPRSASLKAIKWIVALAGAALVVYAASQMSGVAYNEDAIKVVDFSDLKAAEKRSANNARCTCGCGLGLAQCVATDSTCPIRESNIDRIKKMVREAKGS